MRTVQRGRRARCTATLHGLDGWPLVVSCHCLIPHYEFRMECVTLQRAASSSFTSSPIHLGSAHGDVLVSIRQHSEEPGPG